MSLVTILVALAAMAVNFGWQKADDGYEYLVQLEPETLQLLHDGVDVPIDSHVPAGVQPIRRIRIVVGKAELPRDELTATETADGDTAVERSSNYTPPADRRYAQPPAATQPSAIDTMVGPLRKADDLFEQGFEKAVDGLENTGQAVRGAVNNLGTGVQDQLRRSKEMLVGPSPNNGFPAANSATAPAAPAPALGAPPAWPPITSSPTAEAAPSMPSFASPPLAGTGASAGSAPAVTNTERTQADLNDNSLRFPTERGAAAESATGVDSGSRLVPVEPAGSDTAAPSVPAWDPNDPNWPPVSAQPAPSFVDWPGSNTPPPATNVPPPSPPATTSQSRSTSLPSPAPLEASDSPSAQSLGGWALAIIGLAGSVGCNFFLGFSYLDIRNKYRAALRRTSRSFGRPAASA